MTTGKIISLNNIQNKPQGNITLTINRLNTIYSHFGFIQKLTKGAFGSGLGNQYKKRYFILTKDSIKYYTNEYNLNEIKGKIDCINILLININNDIIIINSNNNTKDIWQLKFDENNINEKHIWIHKLRNCCPNVIIDTTNNNSGRKFSMESVASRMSFSIR